MHIIIQTGEKTFTTTNGRGTTMTLSYNEVCGYWQMASDNAAVRAWRSLGVHVFNSLAEVEAKYKTWRGISALIEGV
jgi:hypothetical protein